MTHALCFAAITVGLWRIGRRVIGFKGFGGLMGLEVEDYYMCSRVELHSKIHGVKARVNACCKLPRQKRAT